MVIKKKDLSNQGKVKIVDYKNFVVEPVDISFGANIVLEQTKLTIQFGEHYGLIGKNGIGKTSLLNAIINRQLKIPDRLDMIYVKQEEPESDTVVLDALLSSDPVMFAKSKRLTELEIMIDTDESVSDAIIEELDVLSREIGSDGSRAKVRAQKILSGLGFNITDQQKEVKLFSGGWRMRISLAKALFMNPTLLILDEPTNHLDLHANLWLTSYLKSYKKTILVVSHDQYFIDEVCTTIIHIHNKKLYYYTGNYDKFQRQLQLETDKLQKDWKLASKKVDAMRKKNKTAKAINEYLKANKIVRPEKKYEVIIKFIEPNVLKGNFLNMEDIKFGYNVSSASVTGPNELSGTSDDSGNLIYKDLNLEIKSNSRIAIVGKNGIGKSTLLKLVTNEIEPLGGSIVRNSALKIGYYNQHFEDSMPMNSTGVEFIQGLNTDIDLTTSHKYLSMFGLEPIHHKTLIGSLSGGQKARVKLASFGVIKPHLLVLDEPSNHLDIVAIESLIGALNSYAGAILIVTHNFDLITKLNCELWVVDEDGLNPYQGSYDEYICDVVGDQSDD